MIVFDSIEQKKTSKNLMFQTSRSMIMISVFSFIVSYILFILNFQNSRASQGLIQIITLIFMLLSLFFFTYQKKIILNESQFIIIRSILIFPVIRNEFSLADIQKIYHENRSYGQTYQDKFRIFIQVKDRPISLGVVNHIKKADSFVSSLCKHHKTYTQN